MTKSSERTLSTRRKSVKRALVLAFAVIALVWLLGCSALYHIMRRPPETFARFMAKLPGSVPFLLFPFENIVDPRSRRHPASWRCCAELLPDEARQERLGAVIQFDGARAPCSTDLWQLHLTAVPAGGSRSQQALRPVSKQSCVFGRLYHRGASQRCLADAK